ncbi:MAG: UDP-N-acetylmuramoyl-L-alanyl-D-glutamate--2,6-diaminopimelate ligase [Proteobacteria bacterium]|nr:UDP-N-acetylmuramoyl-L-alanyl-D-glutamate--2,6-diaminopimelate ligase [Pseudomonadota bacterium]
MKLFELLQVLPEFKNLSEYARTTEVRSVTVSSQKAQLGDVFVAIRGAKEDGHDHLHEAIRKGVCAVVVEFADKVPTSFSGFIQVVPNTRAALDHLASQYFEHPSKSMLMFGVTGTNGKTSTTYMLEHVFNQLKMPTGVLGTINHHLLDKVWSTEMTTPGPIELQSRLAEMKAEGARLVAMEVSSHALHQHRADGVHFNTVLFTNLTRDHLDYHQTMKNYHSAKQRLFTDLLWSSRKQPLFAIVNIDDEYGRRMRVCSEAVIWTYGQDPKADFSFELLQMNFSRIVFKLKSPFGSFEGILPLSGKHNLYNAVGALAAAASLGVPPVTALEKLATFKGVPGRLQQVETQTRYHVFVDYAHTPDALENVLKSLVQVRKETGSSARIWTLFGCGGDRDKGKRPVMAQIACLYSDQIIVTSDNPRTEEPATIIADILVGIDKDTRAAKVRVESDRRKAIELAILSMEPADVLLIAGKGHEDYQIIGTEKHPFSDYLIAQEILRGIKS